MREIIRRTLFAKVARPSSLKEGVEPELEQLIMELLAKDPADRPDNARVVVDRLSEIVARRGYRWTVDWPVEESDETPATPTTHLSQLVPTTKLTMYK